MCVDKQNCSRVLFAGHWYRVQEKSKTTINSEQILYLGYFKGEDIFFDTKNNTVKIYSYLVSEIEEKYEILEDITSKLILNFII